MLKLKLMALFCLLISSTAFANPIGMPTGSTGGTYYPMGLDIAKLSAKNGVEVQVKNSLGSLDNIRRMASKESRLIITTCETSPAKNRVCISETK